jgi:hypothetical protein
MGIVMSELGHLLVKLPQNRPMTQREDGVVRSKVQ